MGGPASIAISPIRAGALHLLIFSNGSINPPALLQCSESTTARTVLWPTSALSRSAVPLTAYSLAKGVIRVGLPIPRNAEFTLTDVQDRYKLRNVRIVALRPTSARRQRSFPQHCNVGWTKHVSTNTRARRPESESEETGCRCRSGSRAGNRSTHRSQLTSIVDFLMGPHTTQT